MDFNETGCEKGWRANRFLTSTAKLTFAALQKNGKEGSLLPFAAIVTNAFCANIAEFERV